VGEPFSPHRMSRPCADLPTRTEKRMRALLRATDSIWEMRRIQCVLLRVSEEKTAEQIAPIVGLHPGSVWRIWSLYMKKGEAALLGEQRGRARGNAHLTLAQEKNILSSLMQQAARGRLLTIRDVHAAVCRDAGEDVDLSTTYRMLKRHTWRKIVPLPTHPKGNAKLRETFKESFSPTGEKGSSGSEETWSHTQGHV